MRFVIQRVKHAKVEVEGKTVGEIEQGLLVFCGIEDADSEEDITWMANKLAGMRIFSDDEGKMNLSVKDVGGAILLVSQFTLHASTKKGNRPSFIKAGKPEFAKSMCERLKQELSLVNGLSVETGEFGADMQVSLLNDGPVTIIMDSKNRE